MSRSGAWRGCCFTAALLLVSGWRLAASAQGNAAPELKFIPTELIQFTKGDYLEDLPSASKLVPAESSGSADAGLSHGLDMDISIVAARIQGPVNTPQRNFSFYGYAYKDNTDGSTYLHGPLLTLAAGRTHHVSLTNELTLTQGEKKLVTKGLLNETFNSYRLPTHTNLHQHGLWAYSGVPDLSMQDVPYIGMGDNVYYDLPPKAKPSSTPAQNNFTYVIEELHLPGNHWYHAHFHGSSSLQVQSASGPSLVTSEVQFLKPERGCGPLMQLLERVITRPIYIQAFMFEDAKLAGAPYNAYDIPGYDQISNYDKPPYVPYPNNPLCCSPKRTGYGFKADRVNVALVNGGMQPIAQMTPNVPQRWHIWNAMWKGYVDLEIIDAEGALAPCKFHLLSKDGVYLMDIPRLVTDLVMATANRAEVIVVCSGAVGTRYYLSSGLIPNFGPTYPYDDDADRFVQSNIMEIELVASPQGYKANATAAQAAMKLVKDQGCAPKRPSYVADLRSYQLQGNLTIADASLNTTRKELFLTEVGPYGCEINGRNFSYPTRDPIVLPLGQVLEFHYINQANHPTHLHDHPQQITNLDLSSIQNGTQLPNYFQVGDWQDTFKLPQLEAYDTNTESILTTRFQPGPFNGYTVLHCHFLHHQDVGCMSVVQRPCPSDPYPGPDAVIPFPCPGGFRYPVQGDFGEEQFLGTAKLALRETLAKPVAAEEAVVKPEAIVRPAKCNDALAVMLPCEDQIID